MQPQTHKHDGTTSTLDECVDTATAARVLGLAVATLEKRRVQGKPPRYVKIGRLCRYRKSELERFLSEAERSSTSDRGRAA